MPEPETEPLLMLPGPTPVVAPVLAALGRPTPGHTSATAGRALRRVQAGCLAALGADPATELHVIPGTGTLALESALVNLLAPGDHVVCVSHGYFGDRFADIAERLGAEVTRLQAPWGQRVPLEAVAAAARGGGTAVVTLTQVDTSTAVATPIGAYARAAASGGALVVVDAVAAAGGLPLEMTATGVDVVAFSGQKALGMPPGLALVAIGPRARARRAALARVPSYYLDWELWAPAMADPEGRYFATQAVNLVAAGAAAVAIAEEEGWPVRFARHRRLARAARAGFAALGLEPAAPVEALGPTLTALRLPAGVDGAALRREMLARQVLIAGGLGPWATSTVRIGHMGNIGRPELLTTVAALAEALPAAGGPAARPQAGAAAVTAAFAGADV